MARPRKPTAVLEQNGAFDHNPQRRDARESEPIPTGPLGDPPSSLTDVERGIWHELTLQIPPGVLTIADRMVMEVLCALIARHRGGNPDCQHNCPPDASGSPAICRPDCPNHEQVKPRETLKSSEYSLILSMMSRLGLTPADRSKIKATPSEEEQEANDTFDRLAKQGRGQKRTQ